MIGNFMIEYFQGAFAENLKYPAFRKFMEDRDMTIEEVKKIKTFHDFHFKLIPKVY